MTKIVDQNQYDGLTKFVENQVKELEKCLTDAERSEVLEHIKMANQIRESLVVHVDDEKAPEEPKGFWQKESTNHEIWETVRELLKVIVPVVASIGVAKIAADGQVRAAEIHEAGRERQLNRILEHERDTDDFVSPHAVDMINKLGK